MFKTAAAKIAHNSTIPALAGNQELRPLQDLITAEKAVLISLQKLSIDFTKASDALRTWGLSEGDDLGDILGASAAVLNHFSAALSQYSAHGHGVREQLKAIRSREENLEEMKKRRRVVFRKADDADKKLNKMSPEHKNIQVQADLLNRLRDEIRALDTNIMVETAAIGDFKRTATKMFMGLKFGGLLECCEKGSITATFGKTIVSEISEEQTQPGLHRGFYQGHVKTENLVAEATRALNDVTLSTIPTLAFRDLRQYYNGREIPSIPVVQDQKAVPISRDSSDCPDCTPPRTFPNDTLASPRSPQGQTLNLWPQSQNFESPSFPVPTPSVESPPFPVPLTQRRSSVDDFGMNFVRSNNGRRDNNGGSGGRFATFPVKPQPVSINPPTFSLEPLPLQTPHEMGPSFASSIVDALEHKEDPFADNALVSPASSSLLPLPATSITPSVSTNPWSYTTEEKSGTQVRKSHLSDHDDTVLAYLTSGDDEGESVTPKSSQISETKSFGETQVQHFQEERLGEAPNSAKKLEKRISIEKENQMSGWPSSSSPRVTSITAERDDGSSQVFEGPPSLANGTSELDTTQLSTSQLSPEDQERALNTAAAREITLEIEALKASSRQAQSPLQSNTVDRGWPLAEAGQLYGNAEDIGRTPSPLVPPSAPFARRSVSPHPYPEMNFATPQGSVNHSYGPSHGLVGPPFSPPQESQYFARSEGLPSTQANPFRPQPPTTEYQLPFMNSSLNVSGGVGSNNGTISAAAFKKPRNKSMENLHGLSKGFPGSPVGGGPKIFAASGNFTSNILPSEQLENRLPLAGPGNDYVDPFSQPNSQFKAEHDDRSLTSVDGGYQAGKFSTNLEDSPLR